MFLLWRYSDAAQAEAIHVFCVSIPALLLRSPQTSVQDISHLGEGDLAMRSVQTVNIQETLGCKRYRRSKSPDLRAPDIVFKSQHAGVA